MSHPTTKYKKKKGTRDQVWSGVAQETSGGLRKKDLMISKSGKIVSKKASKSASERMKSGTGLCGFCIEQYKKGKIKNTSNKHKKENKKENKKERTLKQTRPKGASKKRVDELQKEINSLREKAGRIAETKGKITKEVTKMLENVSKKVKERLMMKRYLKSKEKKKSQ